MVVDLVMIGSGCHLFMPVYLEQLSVTPEPVVDLACPCYWLRFHCQLYIFYLVQRFPNKMDSKMKLLFINLFRNINK